MTLPPFQPRYTGLASFMRMPLWQPGEAADIAMVGVPFDGGVTNRPGARHGPREVRNHSSLIRRFSQATGHNPFEAARVVDGGDVPIERPYNLLDAHGDIEAAFHRWREAGLRTLAVGGDHSVSLPILRAVARDRGPLGLVHIDAHCDTGDDYAGSRFHHGSPFRRAAEEGLIDPKRTVQIGIRGSLTVPDQWQFSYDSGMRVMPIEEVYRLGLDATLAEARQVVGDRPCYVTFDIDSVDPAYAPGTGTPEVGGLTALEALLLVRGLSGLDVVSADVVEVAPAYDPTNNTAFLAANVMFELLCVMTGQPLPGS
ncbi:MAG: agmatinase [Alphaproteobacteria bacterium]|nr:agmatinase [Alphaproteobacteria bacterium]